MAGVPIWGSNQKWESLEELLQDSKRHGDKLFDQLDFDKFIENPREVIDDLYRKERELNPEEWGKNMLNALHMKVMERKCSREAPDNKISSLNHPNFEMFKNGQVVSFRCMIQNRIGSEITNNYVTVENPITKEQSVKSTLLQDIIKDVVAIANEEYVEREVFLAITPPGENAKAFSYSWMQETEYLAPENKRAKVEDSDKEWVRLPDFKSDVPFLFKHSTDTKPVACFLKLPRDCHIEEVKPNDVVEVVGLIYGGDTATPDEEDAALFEDIPSEYFKLPTMHVFSCVKLMDGHPKLPLIEGKLFPLFKTDDMNMTYCAKTLKDVLTGCFGGDSFAASYAMVTIVSRVLIHRPSSVDGLLGNFTVNIHGFAEDSQFPELFSKVMKRLFPRTITLDFIVEKMNATRWTPRELKTTQLDPGLLQIPHGTFVLIDETKLVNGKFNEIGIENLRTMNTLIEGQTVVYDYTHQYPELATHVPIVILSTSPSLLQGENIRIKVQPELEFQECAANVWSWMSKHGEDLRDFLCVLRSVDLSQHSVFSTDEMRKQFQKFYEIRNQSEEYKRKPKMTPQEFSSFITASRLWCLLHGEKSITTQGFEYVKKLEKYKSSPAVERPIE